MKNQVFRVSRCGFAPVGLGLMTLVIILSGVFPASALTLILRSQASAPGKEFFVSDLVQIKDGIPPEILGVRMGAAPTFKEPVTITPPMIEMAVKNQVKLPEPITWSGAKACLVNRPSRFVTAHDLNTVILPALTRLTAGVGAVNIQEFAALTPMEIPAGHAQASVELNPGAITNEWTNASVSFLIDGEVVLSRSIRFHWSWIRNVWVAQRDLVAGTKIIPDDFKLAQTNALQGGDLLVSDPSQFALYVLAKPLQVGNVLTQTDIEQKKLVYKGGKVMVKYSVSGLEIKMMAVALQDGFKGSAIPVMNTDSHVHILARVIDQNNLEFIQTL